MPGSPLVVHLIAQTAFWLLLLVGVWNDAVSRVAAVVFVTLWFVGYAGVPRLAPWAAPLAMSWVAVLDIVLVLMVFKGDVPLR